MFKEKVDVINADKLGEVIALLPDSTEIKRKYFAEAFEMSNYSESVDAMLNIWAVATMVESDLSVVRKIEAVRNMLNDENISKKHLEKWVNFIWKRKIAPLDFLDFISIDIRNHQKANENVKKILVEY